MNTLTQRAQLKFDKYKITRGLGRHDHDRSLQAAIRELSSYQRCSFIKILHHKETN